MRLSHRYIPARQLPDKAVSLLDTACARVAVSQHATPAELEDCQRRLEALRTESDILGREAAVGIDVGERRAAHRWPRSTARRPALRCCRSGTRRKRAWSTDPRHSRQVARARGRRQRHRPRGIDAPTPSESATPRWHARRCRRRSPATASPAAAPAPSPDRPSDADRAELLAELRAAADTACRAAGRKAADPAERRRAGRRDRRRRTGPAFRSAGW